MKCMYGSKGDLEMNILLMLMGIAALSFSVTGIVKMSPALAVTGQMLGLVTLMLLVILFYF